METIIDQRIKTEALWKGVIIFALICLTYIFFTPEEYETYHEIFISLGGGIVATGIFLYGYKNIKDNQFYRLALLLTGCSLLIADILWYRDTLYLEIEPSVYSIGTIFSVLANVFLGVAVYQMVKTHFGKWNRLQVLIDGFFAGTLICTAIWFFFWLPLQNSYVEGNKELFDIIVNATYIFVDMFIIFLLIIFYSIKKGHFFKFSNAVMVFGFFIWFLADLLYIYFDIMGTYESSRFIDTMWYLSILIISVASLTSSIKTRDEKDEKNKRAFTVGANFFSIALISLYIGGLATKKPELLFVIVPMTIFKYLISKHLRIYERNGLLIDMANVDVLTNIYNRRKLMEELETLTDRNTKQESFTLLFIDLDGFKSINDNYGHDVGDLLLKESVKRFQNVLGENAFLARQGGDEFVIILRDSCKKSCIATKCKEILNSFEQEFILKDKPLKISISIGASMFPEHSHSHDELMRCANSALHKAKVFGKNQFQIYDEELQKTEERKSQIEIFMRNAEIKEELSILYQPQIDTKTRKIIGVEALLRWENSELGEVTPGEFIPIAEQTGAIHSIGEFVIEEATKDIKYLNEKYGKNIKMAINVSPKQFFSGDIVSILKKNIEKNGIDPKWMDVEITENFSMVGNGWFLEKLKAMDELGVSISVDDFGTGYSSLAYLKNYPISTLKIAMELTGDLANEKDQNYKIVKAVTAMCKEMGIKTIAEGVESLENFEILKEMGCDIIQGYYFSRPIKLEQVGIDFLS